MRTCAVRRCGRVGEPSRCVGRRDGRVVLVDLAIAVRVERKDRLRGVGDFRGRDRAVLVGVEGANDGMTATWAAGAAAGTTATRPAGRAGLGGEGRGQSERGTEGENANEVFHGLIRFTSATAAP